MGLFDVTPDSVAKIADDHILATSKWEEFEAFVLSPNYDRLAQGEMSACGIYPKIGVVAEAPTLLYEKLREICEAKGIAYEEFDCRKIKSYIDVYRLLYDYADGDGKPKVLHISHFTEIPAVPNQKTLANVLVNCWSNPDSVVCEIMLDTRPLLVVLSCDKHAAPTWNPWNPNNGIGWWYKTV